MTYDRLRTGDGLQWPCQATDMADSPILYGEGFQNRKAILSPMTLKEAPEEIDSIREVHLSAVVRVSGLPTLRRGAPCEEKAKDEDSVAQIQPAVGVGVTPQERLSTHTSHTNHSRSFFAQRREHRSLRGR